MATMVESLLSEFREEVPATRRVLERIPADKLGWKPHPKSRSLGELAMHVANIHGMAERIIKFDEFSAGSVSPPTANSVEDIHSTFEKNVLAAEESLSNMTDETAL